MATDKGAPVDAPDEPTFNAGPGAQRSFQRTPAAVLTPSPAAAA